MKYAVAAALSLIAIIAAGCGSSSSGTPSNHAAPATDTSTQTPTATTPPAPPPKPKVEVLFSPSTLSTVHEDAFTVRGTATRGATVSLHQGGHVITAVLHGRHWSAPVTVHMGDNTLRARAKKKGFVSGHDLIVVTRKHSAAERAAIRAQRQQDFMASATTIPYNQLNKDASSYKGKRVVYHGQIFQIQQDGNFGGVMLLSVTDEGYGIWDDHIWVDYDRSIKSAENDNVTVYGTITGSKSYDTQAGGSTYVPRMHAKYIVEG